MGTTTASAVRPTFSVSAIRDYQTCPRMYYFARVLGLRRERTHFSAIFGTAVHWAISHWHAMKRRDDADTLLKWYHAKLLKEIAKANGKNQEIDGFDGEATFEKYAPTAREIFEGYVGDPANDVDLVVNEHGFRVAIRSPRGTLYWFIGFIDQIRAHGDGALHVMDLKTGKTRPDDHLLTLDEQLSLYGIACARGQFRRGREDEPFTIGQHPTSVQIVHLRGYETYKKNQYAETISDPDKVKVPNPKGKGRDVIRKIPNPLFEQGYKKGERKGSVFLRSLRSEFDLRQAEIDLARVCAAIRRKAFYRRPSAHGSCDFCKFRRECLEERAEPI